MTAVRWEPLRLPSLVRIALYRFRWRMRHPREEWPGFYAAVFGELAGKLRGWAEATERWRIAFGGAGEAARDFARSWAEADRRVRSPLHCVAVLALAALAACHPPQRMPLRVEEPVAVEAGAAPYRFEVSRVGTFEDALAYSGVRGVYLIRDRETGAEFVGVSGIGIAELGSHASGKTTVRDER